LLKGDHHGALFQSGCKQSADVGFKGKPVYYLRRGGENSWFLLKSECGLNAIPNVVEVLVVNNKISRMWLL
jgi:hypothetical protein